MATQKHSWHVLVKLWVTMVQSSVVPQIRTPRDLMCAMIGAKERRVTYGMSRRPKKREVITRTRSWPSSPTQPTKPTSDSPVALFVCPHQFHRFDKLFIRRVLPPFQKKYPTNTQLEPLVSNLIICLSPSMKYIPPPPALSPPGGAVVAVGPPVWTPLQS